MLHLRSYNCLTTIKNNTQIHEKKLKTCEKNLKIFDLIYTDYNYNFY